jgi:hypothetical protein
MAGMFPLTAKFNITIYIGIQDRACPQIAQVTNLRPTFNISTCPKTNRSLEEERTLITFIAGTSSSGLGTTTINLPLKTVEKLATEFYMNGEGPYLDLTDEKIEEIKQQETSPKP